MSSEVQPLDRSQPPGPAKLRTFRFPDFQRIRASEALEIYLAPSETGTAGGELLHLELIALRGADAEPTRLGGLAALTGGLLDEGSSVRSALDLARTAESLGGYLGSGADWETLSASGTFLAEHWRQGLELIAEVATDPVFSPEEIERVRARTLAELRNRRAQPGTVARVELVRRLYPATPYERLLIGEEESVAAIGRDDIREFYQAARAGRWVAVACGGMEVQALAEAISQALPATQEPPPPEPEPIHPAQRDSVAIVIVDRPGAAQTELRIGHASVPRTHPDFTALGVLNSILGGKFTSRLNLNLRERHGFTYGAHSRFTARRGPGPFSISTAVDNASAAAAAKEALYEMERIRREPVEEEELADAVSYLLGVFPYTVQTIDGVAARLSDLAVFDLPQDYWDTLPERVGSQTRESLLRAAASHLEPSRAVVVAVGPAVEIEAGFRDLGEVEVVSSSTDP